MNILILQVFVSLMLVAAAVLLFVYTVKSRTFEHADRLALAPLEDDLGSAPEQLPDRDRPDAVATRHRHPNTTEEK